MLQNKQRASVEHLAKKNMFLTTIKQHTGGWLALFWLPNWLRRLGYPHWASSPDKHSLTNRQETAWDVLRSFKNSQIPPKPIGRWKMKEPQALTNHVSARSISLLWAQASEWRRIETGLALLIKSTVREENDTGWSALCQFAMKNNFQ